MDDCDNWNFWKSLLTDSAYSKFPAKWNFYTENKCRIVITNSAGEFLNGVKIKVTSPANNIVWEAETDKFGSAQLFSNLFGGAVASYRITAVYNGTTFQLGSFSGSESEITKQIAVSKIQSNEVDVQFIVDATGSMGDEISYLKTELYDVLQRSKTQLAGVTLKVGAVFYRDVKDEYLTKPFPFTENIDNLTSFIKDQKAGGGGDFPEAVEEACATSLQQAWNTNARTKIAFLILDAPPHFTPAIVEKMNTAVKMYAQKGIKLIPLAASGIDKETEFLLRFMAIATNGTYTFLTNDSGVGNTHIKPTMGKYDVEYLNNQMVRLIVKYSKE